jgi:hypothetical protein
MARSRALVHAFGQRAHAGHAWIHLLAEQHAAAAGLGPLADNDLDRIRAPHVVRIEAVARGQALVDEELRSRALLVGHAAVTSGGRGAERGGREAQRLLGVGGQRAEAHAGHRDRHGELDGPRGVTRAEHRARAAAFAIAFERVARQRGAEEQQVIEMRYAALGAEAANLVQAGGGRALHVIDGVAIEGGGLLEMQA